MKMFLQNISRQQWNRSAHASAQPAQALYYLFTELLDYCRNLNALISLTGRDLYCMHRRHSSSYDKYRERASETVSRW